MKGIDYQRCGNLALVRECKETLQRGVKEIDKTTGQGKQIATTTITKRSFRSPILTKSTFSVVAVSGSSLGVLRVVSRWNHAHYGKTKRERILKKRTFLNKRMRAAPSRRVASLYLRTPPARSAFPRSYCHPTQPKCEKNDSKSKLFARFLAFVHFLLYLCSLK